MDIKQRDDGSVSWYSDTEGFDVARSGGPKSPTAGTGAKYRSKTIAVIPLATTTTATNMTGAVAAWGNFNEDRVITNAAVYIAPTGTTPGCTLEIGVAATATTQSSNLFNGLQVTTSGMFDLATNKGTSGTSVQYLTAGQYVTATPGHSANTLSGNLYIEYFPA